MSRSLRLLALFGFGLVGAGCEQLPEEFHFVNDTAGEVDIILHEGSDGPYSRGKAAPGETFHLRQRPTALHGEKWFADIDDEEQFTHRMHDGVIFVDEKGRRVRLDVKALRAQMTYQAPREFTMHIRADLFEAAR
jgi:hypothetical protein